jgi:hypothetical protein
LYYAKEADSAAMAPQRKDDVKENEMLRNQLQRHTVEQKENMFLLKREATWEQEPHWRLFSAGS